VIKRVVFSEKPLDIFLYLSLSLLAHKKNAMFQPNPVLPLSQFRMHMNFGRNPILQSLTNYIWKYINFVNQMNIYVNIFHDDFNNIDLVLWIMILCSVHLVKVYKVWFSLKLICILIREGASISFLCNRVGLINEFFAS
jgi:hypothetical protein